LESSFAAIDFFERRRIPFVVAVNCFDDGFRYEVEEVRKALAISDNVPIVLCDARQRDSSKLVLIKLLEHTISRLPAKRQEVS
jgi:signal recognition particle receptor subunit beta